MVNVKFADLHQELEKLKQAVAHSLKITDEQKLDVTADIESIRDQLAKEKPDKTIVSRLWSGIQKIVTAAGLVEIAGKVGTLIGGLIV